VWVYVFGQHKRVQNLDEGKAVTGWLRKTFGAGEAAQASLAASEVSAASQEEALNYLREVEALPLELRDEALKGLSAFFQVPSRPRGQQELVDEARMSPLYQAIMGGRQAGEESILRNASATGMLRSGNVKGALTDYGSQLENRALLESFNQSQSRDDYERAMNLSGLSGLAGLGGNQAAIAELTRGIGETRAQGMVGAAQAKATGTQNAMGTLLGLGQMAAMAFSDMRLKDNIRYIGDRNGYAWYAWDWNQEAMDNLGLEGSESGVIAHHVYKTNPDAVVEIDGYLAVDYSKLGGKP
jgi:hypothetical protein